MLRHDRSAQSIIEVLIGVGLGALLVIGATALIAPALRTNQQVSQVQTRAQLAQELLANVKAWVGGNWNSILSLPDTRTVFYLNTTSSPFTPAITGTAIPWPNGYSYRDTITVNASEVPNTDQTSFPLLVSGTFSYLEASSSGGDVVNGKGYDILFTSDASGTSPLSYERELYVATSGIATFWVKIPTLSHTTNTSIYLFFGNASTTSDQSNPTAVWDSNYLGVWHMDDSIAAGAVHDSTANGDNLSFVGAWSAGQSVTGPMGGALSFIGSNSDEIQLNPLPLILKPTSSISLEIWMNRQESDGNENDFFDSCCSFDYDLGVAANGYFLSDPFLYLVTDGSFGGASGISDFAWHFLAATKSSTLETLYLDGGFNGSTTVSASISTGDTELNIGGDDGSDLYGSFYIDEARISGIARSADWITTEYNNYNSPSSFYGITGPVQNVTGGGTDQQAVTVGSTTYNRYFYLSSAYRDSNGNVTTTATGNSYDPSTELLTVIVTASSTLFPGTTTLNVYLSRNGDNTINQTSWAGGSGRRRR